MIIFHELISGFLVLYIIENTSDCDTNMQKCTTELSNTQTGSAMQLSGMESFRGDELTNAEALASFLAVNIKEENPAHLRSLIGIVY